MSDIVVLRELIRRKYKIDKGLFAYILYGNVPKAPPYPPLDETPRWITRGKAKFLQWGNTPHSGRDSLIVSIGPNIFIAGVGMCQYCMFQNQSKYVIECPETSDQIFVCRSCYDEVSSNINRYKG